MMYMLFKTRVERHKETEFHEAFPKMISGLEKGGAKIIGVWTVEMGPLEQVLLLYGVENYEGFQKALEGIGLYGDPSAHTVLPNIYTNTERWILRPTPYSPLQ